MVPGLDSMGAPGSFTARRSYAQQLPTVELPPPPFPSLHQRYPSYQSFTAHPTHSTLTPIPSLLTPPSISSAESLSPSSGPTSASSQSGGPPYTPTGGGMWPPPNTHNASYGFQTAPAPQHFAPARGIFSPSLNSIVRGNPPPTNSEGLPPPPYEVPQYSAAQVPMSAPSLASAPPQHHMISSAMIGGHSGVPAPVSQASPVSAQEAFARPPPTPTYYNNSQPSSAAPPQGAFQPYAPGPSPVQQSPISGAGSIKMSPVNGAGPMPPLQSHSAQFNRPYSYPLPGPVLSNVNNPGGQLQMVGGLPHGMVPGGFNSGHAAHMQQIYGHPQQQNQQNDRPFRCDQCPQSFNRNHDLKRHKRIHLAVKPFPCGHCDKSFSRKDALKRHVLVKGCGKAHATAEVKEIDGSMSPKSESSNHSAPVTSAG